MHQRLIATLFLVASISAFGHADLRDYLRANRIRTAIEPVITQSTEYNCDEIALSMIRLANPRDNIDLECDLVKRRMREAIRMARDTAIHTREVAYIRLFNACLVEMGEQTAPTGQYLLLDSSLDHSLYPEFNNPIVKAYQLNPQQNPRPDYMNDLIRLSQIMRAIEATDVIPHGQRCSALAKRMLEMTNGVKSIDLADPSMSTRAKKVHELALLTFVWMHRMYFVLKFHKCLVEFGAEIPSTAFYIALALDENLIGPIKLPENHSRRINEFTDLNLN